MADTVPCTKCERPITFAFNVATTKRVPLVPFDPAYPKAVRYDLLSPEGDVLQCKRNNEGEWMSHFADCSDPGHFSGRNK